MSEKLNLNTAKPISLVDYPELKERYVQVYSKIHLGHMDEARRVAEAEMVFEREAMYYRKAIMADEKLKNSTAISCYSAFLETAITGLSIQPGSKSEAYLQSRGQNIGGKEKAQQKWIQVCNFVITAYGELNMRIRAGQIIRMTNPQIIYHGDHFQPMTNEKGQLYVDYRPVFPRKSQDIIGCWVAIHLPGGAMDFKWLEQEDVKRLMGYSEKGMGGKANALYTSNKGQIDPGFLETKTIKHALRAYTKLRVGENTTFEGEIDEETNEPNSFATTAPRPDTVNYNASTSQPVENGSAVPVMEDDDMPF